MQISNSSKNQDDTIAQLFKDTFTDSEGAEEGAVIHHLVRDLLNITPKDDLHIYTAHQDDALCACAVFTQMRFADDPRQVFLLSPMAVATAHQGQGVGQKLLTHALKDLKAQGVAVAVTYGDPNFYGRVGFTPVTTQMVPAPQPLSMPEGWIAQSLSDTALTPLPKPALCAPALDHPDYW
ncbi:GNAT family N-acetyltransferase [Marivita sp.]|uniref:GNAT family N-acetyltransferase n=1 Tax=Marivita sp. TaxID=2003365 RepID=UPI003F6D16AF